MLTSLSRLDRRRLALVALAIIVAYGALLRFHALFETYGRLERPGWLAALHSPVTTLGDALSPRDWHWPRDEHPYSSGDPSTYLRFAREMTSFYQPHVREPVFPASVKTTLWLVGDADVGISLTSIAFSLLVIVATYLLGAQFVSRPVGLAAAAMMAIDHDVLEWAIGGWRDEAFTALALLAVWTWIRVARAPTYRNAAWAGIAGGLACLTRLTAPFVWLPAAAFVLVAGGTTSRRERVPVLALGLGLATVLVAPYLVSCAIEFGDPFYAVNYHTQFYRQRAGQSAEIVSTTAYLWRRIAEGPIGFIDTILQGLFVYPFVIKWSGLNMWWPGLGTLARALSLAGLLLWIYRPGLRVLLAVLFCSLVPYMTTWSISGGGEWRFTMHAYPIYLVAAGAAVAWLTGVLRRGWAGEQPDWRGVARRALGPAVALVVAVVWTYGAPYLMLRESLVRGQQAVLIPNRRDAWLLPSGWSALSTTGTVTARFNTAAWSRVRLPLPERRAYDLVLRLDPVPVGGDVQRVRVFLNGQALGRFDLTWNPERVGRYSLRIPEELVRAGPNELAFQADHMVDATLVADRYPSIATAGPVGFRLWSVIVTPADATRPPESAARAAARAPRGR
jgi:4-amino-4-deoxy-L-arabinose transferase-like glycosyltransferase